MQAPDGGGGIIPAIIAAIPAIIPPLGAVAEGGTAGEALIALPIAEPLALLVAELLALPIAEPVALPIVGDGLAAGGWWAAWST